MPADSATRFTVRSYARGDEAAILDLFARSFHERRPLEHWRWKYENDPYGAHRISVTFDENGALVGHYAAYPLRIESPAYPSGSFVHQIGDTMTEPSIRHIGRGPTSVLGRTALHFYENFCEGQVAFNFGFNVSNIQKFSLRFLRSTRVEPVAYRYRDLRADPVQRLTRLERYARGISFELATHADAEWDELFARVAAQYGFLMRRDSRYAGWRYFARPDVEYFVVTMRKWGRLVGWLVFRIRENRITIGDVLLDADHADVLEAALRHLVPLYPAEAIEMWCPARPRWMAEILATLHLELRPEPQDLSVMCVPFVDADAPARMAASLYYTMGDGDLF